VAVCQKYKEVKFI